MDDYAGLHRDLAAMTEAQRSVLSEGWLSPRMRKMLIITAEIDGDTFHDAGHLFRPRVPTPLEECCDGFNRIAYIPLHVLTRDRRGIFQSFHDGYAMCFPAIAAILRRNKAPTVQRIREELILNDHLYDGRKLRFYLERGGRIEYALYAVIQITENVLVNGDDGWEYELFQEDIEALPSNPLDGRFEVARRMCVDHGGGTPQDDRGPYREVYLYEFERGNDESYADY